MSVDDVETFDMTGLSEHFTNKRKQSLQDNIFNYAKEAAESCYGTMTNIEKAKLHYRLVEIISRTEIPEGSFELWPVARQVLYTFLHEEGCQLIPEKSNG